MKKAPPAWSRRLVRLRIVSRSLPLWSGAGAVSTMSLSMRLAASRMGAFHGSPASLRLSGHHANTGRSRMRRGAHAPGSSPTPSSPLSIRTSSKQTPRFRLSGKHRPLTVTPVFATGMRSIVMMRAGRLPSMYWSVEPSASFVRLLPGLSEDEEREEVRLDSRGIGIGFPLTDARYLSLDGARVQDRAHSLLHRLSGEPRRRVAASGPELPAR